MPVNAVFHQPFCFLIDRPSRHPATSMRWRLTGATPWEIQPEPDGLPPCAMKEFSQEFGWGSICLFRPILHPLFLWRLRPNEPEVIALGPDTMGMDNEEA